VAEAIPAYREALQINPNRADIHDHLGFALFRLGGLEEAIAEFREALRIDPTYPGTHYHLASALLRRGLGEEAIKQLQEAVELEPDNVTYENILALLLATAPQSSLRNGPRALELASKASQATGGRDPMILRTLAAAYAETGKFPDAAETARHALQLAQAQSNKTLAGQLQREIGLYEAGRRFENSH